MLVRYYGHVGAASGYGHAANETCMAMLDAGIDLEISTDGKQLRHPHLPLSRCIRGERDLTGDPDVVIVHTLPISCGKVLQRADVGVMSPPLDRRRRAVAYTTWEGASPASDAVANALGGFTDVWVPSEVTTGLMRSGGVGAPVSVVPHAYFIATGERAARACSRCGDFHALRFEVGAPVTTPDGTGTVFSWGQYGGPVWIRVQFEDGDRKNYDPCQLTAPRALPYRFYYVGAWAIRKNVEGVIRAYLRSFSPVDNVELVIQSSGAAESACDVTRIATGLTLEQMPPVRFSSQRVSDEQIREIHRSCQCFVTATRGEAWNLPAFDAMLHGNHIIAPAGMGSDDFLTGTSADLYSGIRVPAGGEVRLVADPMAPAGHATGVYLGTEGLTVRSEWIDPDIVLLGKLMRQAYVENTTNLRVTYDPAARFGRAAVGKLIKSMLEGPKS
jgi:glycosyltransferase involved in cell wall biosynthesis